MARLKLAFFWCVWFTTNLVWTPFEWLMDHLLKFLDDLASYMVRKGTWRN